MHESMTPRRAVPRIRGIRVSRTDKADVVKRMSMSIGSLLLVAGSSAGRPHVRTRCRQPGRDVSTVSVTVLLRGLVVCGVPTETSGPGVQRCREGQSSPRKRSPKRETENRNLGATLRTVLHSSGQLYARKGTDGPFERM